MANCFDTTEIGLIKTITLSDNGNNGLLIEDLSFDYSQVLLRAFQNPVPSSWVRKSMLGPAGAIKRYKT
jgi:hypothetical protein